MICETYQERRVGIITEILAKYDVGNYINIGAPDDEYYWEARAIDSCIVGFGYENLKSAIQRIFMHYISEIVSDDIATKIASEVALLKDKYPEYEEFSYDE